MAGRIVIDTQEVLKFVSQLKAFNDLLEQQTKTLDAQFKRLGESWKDAEYKKFSVEFEKSMNANKKFLAMSNGYGPYLLKKIKPLEQYRR